MRCVRCIETWGMFDGTLILRGSESRRWGFRKDGNSHIFIALADETVASNGEAGRKERFRKISWMICT